MQTNVYQKAKVGLMALLLVVGLMLILLAFRPQIEQVSTPSMSVLGALQPIQAPVVSVAVPAAEHRRAYEPNIELFRQEYFALNHPEVLR